jgi:hypothetical protein
VTNDGRRTAGPGGRGAFETWQTRAASSDQRPLLIVVSSLGASSREAFFQSIATEHRIWLFLGGAGRANEATWELPYIAGHTVVDTQDSEAMLSEARVLAAQSRIGGVICFDEARIEAAAELATALGLPTSGVEAVTRCRDKWQTRQVLAAARVPQAASVVLSVEGVEDAKAVPDVITVVVGPKPGNRVNELRSSWDRVALVTASAINTTDALRRAQEAIAAIRIRVTPAAALPMEIAVA